MPTPLPYEKLEDYLQRCIPVEVAAGKDNKQAAAICVTKYRES